MPANVPLVAQIMVTHSNQAMGATTPGRAATSTGGGGQSSTRDAKRVIKNDETRNKHLDEIRKLNRTSLKTARSYLSATFGVQVTMSAMLKQSQIFTGILGSLFSLFGTFIDVILAPFVPAIAKGIRYIASLTPYIRKAADNIGSKVLALGAIFVKVLNLLGLSPMANSTKFKQGLGYVIVGVFFARIFNLHKLLMYFLKFILMLTIRKINATIATGNASQVTLLKIIAANTNPIKNVAKNNVASGVVAGSFFTKFTKLFRSRTFLIVAGITALIAGITWLVDKVGGWLGKDKENGVNNVGSPGGLKIGDQTYLLPSCGPLRPDLPETPGDILKEKAAVKVVEIAAKVVSSLSPRNPKLDDITPNKVKGTTPPPGPAGKVADDIAKAADTVAKRGPIGDAVKWVSKAAQTAAKAATAGSKAINELATRARQVTQKTVSTVAEVAAKITGRNPMVDNLSYKQANRFSTGGDAASVAADELRQRARGGSAATGAISSAAKTSKIPKWLKTVGGTILDVGAVAGPFVEGFFGMRRAQAVDDIYTQARIQDLIDSGMWEEDQIRAGVLAMRTGHNQMQSANAFGMSGINAGMVRNIGGGSNLPQGLSEAIRHALYPTTSALHTTNALVGLETLTMPLGVAPAIGVGAASMGIPAADDMLLRGSAGDININITTGPHGDIKDAQVQSQKNRKISIFNNFNEMTMDDD